MSPSRGGQSRGHSGGVQGPRFGWHNLRHSLATFFASNDVNLPVIQSMLRQAKPTTTARYYMHSVPAPQLAAQLRFMEAIKVAPGAE